MQLLLDSKSHHDWIKEHIARKPNKVIITTFGIWAGILANGQDTQTWGNKYKLETSEILQYLSDNSIATNIIVGIGDYKSCKKDDVCLDCEKTYVESAIRLGNHAQAFPLLKWRFSTNLHIKTTLMVFGDHLQGIVGGRNFTNSNWEDCTVVLDQENCKTLLEYSVDLWRQSKNISDSEISKLLEKQGISEEILE